MTDSPFPPRSQRRRHAKIAWYLRTAEWHGLVPTPASVQGVTSMMLPLLPDIFRSVPQVGLYAARRPTEIVLEHREVRTSSQCRRAYLTGTGCLRW